VGKNPPSPLRFEKEAGIKDQLIDTFCGGVLGSFLVRHFSDNSPKVLKVPGKTIPS
jgi:hypothetical protein